MSQEEISLPVFRGLEIWCPLCKGYRQFIKIAFAARLVGASVRTIYRYIEKVRFTLLRSLARRIEYAARVWSGAIGRATQIQDTNRFSLAAERGNREGCGFPYLRDKESLLLGWINKPRNTESLHCSELTSDSARIPER